MKIILGLIGLYFGISIVYHQVQNFHFFPFIIGCILIWLGYSVLTGKIKL